MRKFNITQYLIIFTLMISLTGCEIIGGIFEAGMWAGIIIVVLVIALVIWLFKKLF